MNPALTSLSTTNAAGDSSESGKAMFGQRRLSLRLKMAILPVFMVFNALALVSLLAYGLVGFLDRSQQFSTFNTQLQQANYLRVYMQDQNFWLATGLDPAADTKLKALAAQRVDGAQRLLKVAQESVKTTEYPESLAKEKAKVLAVVGESQARVQQVKTKALPTTGVEYAQLRTSLEKASATDADAVNSLRSLLLSHCDQLRSSSVTFLIVVSSLLAGLFVLFAVLLARLSRRGRRALIHAVAQMDGALAAMEEGDLTIGSEHQVNDEVGDMVSKLEEARLRLAALIGQASATVTEVVASSGKMSQVAGQVKDRNDSAATQSTLVAEAAQEVSVSVQTVAAGVEQMGASIREIASNSNQAAEVAAGAMASATQTQEVIARLGESSRKIGRIVQDITQIADQTNMLALNATIEAARAGEAGKGFAVVAGEVKDLATKTAKATAEIHTKVDGIQTETREAVDAIAQIATIIGQINDYQSTIATAVEAQTLTTNDISVSVSLAATGSSHIANSIEQYAQAAQQNKDPIGAVCDGIEELAGTADQMVAKVASFRV